MQNSLKGKIAVALVSVSGIVGLAFALLYLVAVLLSFTPGFEWVAKIMIGDVGQISYGFLTLVIPYLFLILHLYLRTKLAIWLFENHDFALARHFATQRQNKSILVNATEAVANRSVLAALLLQEQKWTEATHLLKEKPKLKNPFLWYWAGWKAELFWRLGEQEKLRSFFEKTGTPSGKNIARYAACRAQFYMETGDITQAKTNLELAIWQAPTHPRVRVAQSTIENKTDEASRDAWNTYVLEIPSATTELALFFSEPIVSGSADPRSLRLMKETLGDEEE